jgi:DNA-binding MarR family transcriptional regulator
MIGKDKVSEEDAIALPDLDGLPRDTLMAAHTLRRSVTRFARKLRGFRSDHEISGAKLSLLGRLHRANSSLIAADIARLEHLQPQSLTRIVAELDELGLIRRRQDEFDRRQLLIEITPRGKKLLAQNAVQQNLWLARAMTAQLTKAERDMLRVAAELLDRLADDETEPKSN